MTPKATIDFETYSEAGFEWDGEGKWRSPPGAQKKGLPAVGAAVYAEHPSTEVLTLSYKLGHAAPVQRWRPGLPLPTDLFAWEGLIEAHNVMFERLIWHLVCEPKYGFPPLDVKRLRCSMATARVNNLPGKLEILGDVLRLPTRKDKEGTRLIGKFSVPRNLTKKDDRLRILPVYEDEE